MKVFKYNTICVIISFYDKFNNKISLKQVSYLWYFSFNLANISLKKYKAINSINIGLRSLVPFM